MPQKVDVVDENENKEEVADEEVEEVKEVKMVPKRIQCPRCKGRPSSIGTCSRALPYTAGHGAARRLSLPTGPHQIRHRRRVRASQFAIDLQQRVTFEEQPSVLRIGCRVCQHGHQIRNPSA